LSSETVELWRPEKIIVSIAGKTSDEFVTKGEKLSCPSKCSMVLFATPPEKGSGGAADTVEFVTEEVN